MRKIKFMKEKKMFIVFSAALFCAFFSISAYCSADAARGTMTEESYQKTSVFQNNYHQIYRSGVAAERRRDYDAAIRYYENGLNLVRGYGPETIFRSKLRTSCEQAGYYEKALVHTEWFLSKSNQGSPLWPEYVATKQRLLQKIEAQKRGEKIKEVRPAAEANVPQPIKKISDFHTADYAAQKKFLEKELPEDSNILRLSKQAMLAEHSGDFKSAKVFYEQLLADKDTVTAAQGELAWPMLHCAVQRMSELTGDEAREREMLVWIRDNMLSDQGPYHQYLSGLLPGVQDHLKERLRKFNLGS